MPISAVKFNATAVEVAVNDDIIVVVLADGRELAVPLAWFRAWRMRRRISAKTGVSSAAASAFIGPMSTRMFPSHACCRADWISTLNASTPALMNP